MTWVLVIMLCQRVCVPNIAETFESKAACMVVVDKDTGVFHQPRSYCVPVVKGASS